MADNLSKYLQDSRLKYYRHEKAIDRLDDQHEEAMRKGSRKLLERLHAALQERAV